MGIVKAVGTWTGAVGAQSSAVEAWPRTRGRCQGPWGHGQDRGGAAMGRGRAARGVAKNVGARSGVVVALPRAVGTWPRPCGRSLDGRSAACGRGDRPTPWRRGQGPCGHGQDREGAAKGCGGATKNVWARL